MEADPEQRAKRAGPVEISFEHLSSKFDKKRKRVFEAEDRVVLKKQKTQEAQSPAKSPSNNNNNKYHKRMSTNDKAKINMLKERRKDQSKVLSKVESKVTVETRLKSYKNDLLRPSVYLPMHRDDFLERFEVLWNEHIDGFKKRKLPKSENDLNMEWRVRLKEKEEREARLSDARNKSRQAASLDPISSLNSDNSVPSSSSLPSSSAETRPVPSAQDDGEAKKADKKKNAAEMARARDEAIKHYQAIKRQKLQGGSDGPKMASAPVGQKPLIQIGASKRQFALPQKIGSSASPYY